MVTLNAHFDGKVIVPDEPLDHIDGLSRLPMTHVQSNTTCCCKAPSNHKFDNGVKLLDVDLFENNKPDIRDGTIA